MTQIFKIIKGIAKEHNMPYRDVAKLIQNSIKEAILANYPSTTQVEIVMDVDEQIFTAKIRKKVSVESSNGYYIPIEDAKKYDENVAVGDWIWIPVNLKELGRISANIVKKAISHEFESQDSQKIFEEFAGKKSTIISGVVLTETEHGDIVVDLKTVTGIMPRREQIPNETLVAGDVIKSYILDVEKRRNQTNVLLSRSHPGMLRRLMEINIPEIKNGAIAIKSIARDPGMRAKVAVYTKRANVDPVGVCVGIKGVRIDAIVNELNGERIDVIKWSPEIAIFIANAAKPAKINQIEIDEEKKEATLFVDRNNIALAIGKKGQNVRLISKLTGYKISIEREEEMDKNYSCSQENADG